MAKRFLNYKLITFALILLCTFSSQATSPPKVALVLGGGAARGFSHIGLIHALEDNGIPIDILVGTSMGSIVSSLYAAGYSVENMSQIVQQLDTGSLVDITIPPQGGFVGTTRLEKYLDVLLQGKTFSQLDIPFYSVITNLRTGEELALNEGFVSTGVLASMSIPALFPPVMINDQYYVDGGMKNAVPANVAKDFGADVIIAVDVKKDLKEIDYDNILTNLQLTLWFMIDGYVETSIKDADVVIVPEVQYDSYMEFYRARHFIDQGYLAGLSYMEPIKQAILAYDPEFQFVPYATVGYTDTQVDQLIVQAERQATNMVRPFAIVPELSFSEQDSYPKLGLRVENGPLWWFNLGYRYGFSPEAGGHELFGGWAKPNIGQLEVFARKGSQQPTWGVAITSPTLNNTYLTGLYLSQGEIKWQLSVTNPVILKGTYWGLGTTVRLTEERMPKSGLYLAVRPTVKVFTAKEFISILEVVLARPYFSVGIEGKNGFNKWQPTLSYQVGVGSELQLFGLYPLDLNFSIQADQNKEITYRLGVQGGIF